MMQDLIFTAQLDVLDRRSGQYLRESGRDGDLSQLGADAFFSFSLYLQNTGSFPCVWQDIFVRIDGGTPLRWSRRQLDAGSRCALRISHGKMVRFTTPGIHEVIWYLNGKQVHRECFCLWEPVHWERIGPAPSANYRNRTQRRSAYVCGWLDIPESTRYTEYMVDLKADYLPRGTYCCLGNWRMDLTGLSHKHRVIRPAKAELHAYAGLQRLADGRPVSIMSFWDMECTDFFGRKSVRHATRLYPAEVLFGGRFWGEGEGERSLVPFYWKAKQWYRMHLKCSPGQDEETTIVEQWILDPQTGLSTLLTRYSVPIPNSAFCGPIAVFLENFLPEFAGELRTMEVSNVRYLDAATRRWRPITSVQIGALAGPEGYEGNCEFGVCGSRIWMLTCGDRSPVGQDKPYRTFKLKAMGDER